MTGMRIRAGTSGYSYKEWRGTFYPEKAKPDEMLAFYGSKLPTVEINNTFYRMPKKTVVESWGEQVPDEFSFVVKASRRITHFKRLKDTGEVMGYMLEVATALGQKLGPILFQLPPNFRKDVERLREFAATLPEGLRGAFEFRHESWFDDEVTEVLRERNLALVLSDGGRLETGEIVPTASYGYLRLRREDYDDDAIARWAGAIKSQPWEDAWVFFKHEDGGAAPRFAQKLMDSR